MTLLLLAAALLASDWTEPVHVFHDENLCVSYTARLDGPFLIVKAQVAPGWHTFTMDNRIRAQEALAKSGKPVLGMDQPTRFTVTGGWKVAGPWLQSAPADFSKPDKNWFSWGYEGDALFAAKVTGAGPGKIQVRGQSCSDKSCRNIDVEIELPASQKATGDGASTKALTPVRLR
jgi:hypothetical protein